MFLNLVLYPFSKQSLSHVHKIIQVSRGDRHNQTINFKRIGFVQHFKIVNIDYVWGFSKLMGFSAALFKQQRAKRSIITAIFSLKKWIVF